MNGAVNANLRLTRDGDLPKAQKPDVERARRAIERLARRGWAVRSLFGHSLQLRVLCRKDWLSVRKEALLSVADGAASARDPTAPSA